LRLAQVAGLVVAEPPFPALGVAGTEQLALVIPFGLPDLAEVGGVIGDLVLRVPFASTDPLQAIVIRVVTACRSLLNKSVPFLDVSYLCPVFLPFFCRFFPRPATPKKWARNPVIVPIFPTAPRPFETAQLLLLRVDAVFERLARVERNGVQMLR